MLGKIGINKETSDKIDETKNDIKEGLQNLIESGQAMTIGILVSTSLTVGYILGAIKTSDMHRTMEITRK